MKIGVLGTGVVGRTIGSRRPERFALLHFRALAASDDSPLTLTQGATQISTVPVSNLTSEHLRFESQTITVVSAEQPIESALADVQTVPPRSPTNDLIAAAELM